jgi:FMN phosphatase YigB (HAD superfamily)
MIYWIFDMDDTLYQRGGKTFTYDMLKRDNELIYLLKKLEGRKILLTNGTHQHTNIVLEKMDLTSVFDLILDRNILGALKPDPQVFYKVTKWCSIGVNDTCIYFEDILQNLVVASQAYGWILVHIDHNSPQTINRQLSFTIENFEGKRKASQAIINYSFKNIKSALRHFVNKTI